MLPEFSFQIPPELLHQWATGGVVRFGSLLKDSETGRIVAHLQEASNAASMFTPTGIAGLVADGVQIYQNEQIRSLLTQLQTMMWGVAGLGVINLGVSVAGFAILRKRISALEDHVAGIELRLERTEKKIDEVRAAQRAEPFRRLRALAEQVTEAWNFSDPGREWAEAARRLRELQIHFLDEGAAYAANPATAICTISLSEVGALAGSLEVYALLGSNEGNAAEFAAGVAARNLEAVTGAIGLPEVLAGLGGVESVDKAYPETVERLRSVAVAMVTQLREREVCAATTTLTINELRKQGIAGRAWLEAARMQKTAPLLALRPA